MANPYHDETGRFCSRDLMLTSIHNLAVAGKVEEYIKLKSEFDDIDKGNVVISKETLSNLLVQAGVEALPPEELDEAFAPTRFSPATDYSKMNPETVATLVEELAWSKAYEDAETGEEILSILKSVDYQEDVLYAAVASKALPYDIIAPIVKEQGSSLFYTLAEKYPEEVFQKDKEAFVNTLKTLHQDSVGTVMNHQRFFQINSMNVSLMNFAETLEDLETVATTIPYEYSYRSQQVGAQIVSHPKITKKLALRVLDDEHNSGIENYWSVRRALTKTLQNKAFILNELNGYIPMPPLKGSAPQRAFENLKAIEARMEPGENVSMFVSEGYTANAHIGIDIYETNYAALQQELKEAITNQKLSKVRELQARDDNAKTFLAQNDDYDSFRAHVARLKF